MMNSKNPRICALFLRENEMRSSLSCFLLCISIQICRLGEVRATKDDLPAFSVHLFFFFTAAVDPLDPQFFVKVCLSELNPVLDSVAIDRVLLATRFHLARSPGRFFTS